MPLAIQHGFSEVVLLFFFLLVCEFLSPVCPPKISFKNLQIDIQYFMKHKYRLRGQINILASTIIISQSCLDLLFVNTYKCYNNDIQLNINKISIDKVTTNDIPFRMLEKYPR